MKLTKIIVITISLLVSSQLFAGASNVYFGDTHLHTRLSGDARGYGLSLGPTQAYQVARGEEIISTTGLKVKLQRPLDFLVVADHAEGIGVMDEIINGNPDLVANPMVRKWHEMLQVGGNTAFMAVREIITAQGKGELPLSMTSNLKITGITWKDYLETAEQYNEPGKFTALLGFEWTAMREGNNLHRVVVYRDGSDKVSQTLPIDSNATAHDPQLLWKALDAYEKKTGGQVLAIPHNPNLSNGMMFAMTDANGDAITKAYAEVRARWEPLLEVTQIKGDSEAHPYLSANDEFADYETWDLANLTLSEKKQKSMLVGEYARSGLKRGLQLDNELGVNPFKFGMIGSSDSHTAIPVTVEKQFFGKQVRVEPSATRWKKYVSKSTVNDMKIKGWKSTSSGLAAVWANDNTREELFDSMQRKEVYATTGSRITLRFFAGWEFSQQDANNRNFADIGYKKGVPMGSDLTDGSLTKKPTFIVAANKDALGANLDRIQIIKGWIEVDGSNHEKIINVAWSGERKLVDGKLADVGNTVDVADASWSNSIGSTELRGFWEDDEFSPIQNAFYYVRVIEIPTPRWTAYDAKQFQIKMSDEVPMITRERAYSSPIWFSPLIK